MCKITDIQSLRGISDKKSGIWEMALKIITFSLGKQTSGDLGFSNKGLKNKLNLIRLMICSQIPFIWPDFIIGYPLFYSNIYMYFFVLC